MRQMFLKVLIASTITVICAAQEKPKTHGGTPPKTDTSRTAATGSSFTLSCTLPFDAIATKPDPFVECGNCGVVTKNDTAVVKQAKTLQNHAKNNFCADMSTITVVTFANLRDMQAQAKQDGLVTTDLSSRDKLHSFFQVGSRKIGEGDVVRLKAWILDAHVSDCAGGESVNCESNGFTHNDLHIPLLDPTSAGRTQDECSSVTAEMSPHFRPKTWADLDKNTPVKNVVRVTGPLFFDNAHRPCAGLVKVTTGTKKDEPPFRSSLWEIHPVLQFEVCSNTDPAKCDINNNATWIPYDKWVVDPKNAGSIQDTGSKRRDDCAHPKPPKNPPEPAQCPAK